MQPRGRRPFSRGGGRGERAQPEGTPNPQGRGESSRGQQGVSRARSAGRVESQQSTGPSSRGHGSPRNNPRGGRGESSTTPRGTAGPSYDSQRATQGVTDLSSHQQIEANVRTIAVRRPGLGNLGERCRLVVNTFPTKVQPRLVYQYDADIKQVQPISANIRQTSATVNMRIVSRLQEEEQGIFTPRAVYDSQRKMYAVHDLALGSNGSREWNFTIDGMGYEVRVKRVGEPIDTRFESNSRNWTLIRPKHSVLHRFIEGAHPQENSVIEARQALDVALRMTPLTMLKIGQERRTFYPPSSGQYVGLGIDLCRGYFQSLRPAPSRLLLNVDVCTGAMYHPGPLPDLACQFLSLQHADSTARIRNLARTLKNDQQKRQQLVQFIAGVRVQWPIAGTGTMARALKGFSAKDAHGESFARRSDGRTTTIARYFSEALNQRLVFPELLCVQFGRPEVGRGALVPMELCTVLPDQPLRTALPEEFAEAQRAFHKKHREFSAQPPKDRLELVKHGLQVLGYSQSDYVRQFGVTVLSSPLSTQARILQPPILRYRPAPGSSDDRPTVRPRNGQWSMTNKHFYKPTVIQTWALISCVNDPDYEATFLETDAPRLVSSFMTACQESGVRVVTQNPVVTRCFDSRLDILMALDGVEKECIERSGKPTTLYFVILPDQGHQEVYRTVKNWGDVMRGIPTQCMRRKNSLRSESNFWLNVLHKSINAKLGGINMILDRGVPLLGDPQNGTMVMGADVRHPNLGSFMQGSYTGVVSSLDAHASKYAATMRVQDGPVEMIQDLGDMTAHLLERYMRYRRQKEGVTNPAPKRIIFYRDGVSDGQFQTSLDEELTQIQAVCRSLKIRPKITFIVVGKRHHLRSVCHMHSTILTPRLPDRFFNGDGNCLAGTVIDRDVVHPTEFDFFLQSHKHGISERGTSRPAHYSVLYDENQLSPDVIQTLSYALCHVYARSNRAVSIPAPVYYAHQICARGGIHFSPRNPGGEVAQISRSSPSPEHSSIPPQQEAFQLLHPAQEDAMFFA
ncbi:argonaute-like protein [Mycena belliarum]|uniref:Argonaute-like protein n=1 Tax=Mycena belliarum TaxID=1033014 RepID=A0AAD6XSY2_9AGAR|nr:argonaute-like protein [Mycena belliae]